MVVLSFRDKLWEPPFLGFYKVNVDGSCCGGSLASEGVLRDSDGRWVTGFMAVANDANVFVAELLAIKGGLELVQRYEISFVILESGFMDALMMVFLEKVMLVMSCAKFTF
ncbi:hypothetical protein RJT34_25412 [Clitoria ternatea]|uniref:RNase H type-1 domain-containing protein n=1 Tax=Clitoria ternatea TaxID=43366 RepID=A0AAN9FPU1_CLITE